MSQPGGTPSEGVDQVRDQFGCERRYHPYDIQYVTSVLYDRKRISQALRHSNPFAKIGLLLPSTKLTIGDCVLS